MGESSSRELRAEEAQGGMQRRTLIKGAAWSVPVVAAAVALPGASASTSGLILPACVSGMYGGGWTIPTRINPATGYAPTAVATRVTAARVPVKIVPAVSRQVSLTITGAGYSFLTVPNGAGFSPAAATAITVTTDASGNAEVFVAIPPYGKGALSANIVATAQGLNSASTVVRPYPGYVYTIGGHTPEGQTANGLVTSAPMYPTPWPVQEQSTVYASLSSVMAITASGRVYTSGYNPYGEVATGDQANRLTAAEALKDDGSTFTNAVRGIIGKHGSEEGVFMIEDANGDWWAAGENYQNYLQIPGASTAYTVNTRFTRVGGALPGTPVWASYPRNSQMMLWTLADGTVWAAGAPVTAYGTGLGIGTPAGPGLRQVKDRSGAPVTGVKKAVQSNDTAILLLKDDGTLWYSTQTTPLGSRPIDYTDLGYLQQIAPPPGGSVEDVWQHQPYDQPAGFLAKMSDGTVWAFGGNEEGAWGNGSVADTREWVRAQVDNVIDGGSGADSLLLLDANGEAWYSGFNEENASGMDTQTAGVPIPTPVKITSLPPAVTSVAVTWWDATIASIASPGPAC
ncbi:MULTISPECIES: hypothetical protein [Bacteria]|uniref:hypothetical protein n=1 Tax=Bacteria TaxID=2 RepID=UPI003C7C286B